MAYFRKIKAGLVQNEILDFIGEEGNIFFNVETGEFRLSDGVTPGGLPLSGGTGGTGSATRAAFILDVTSTSSIVSNKTYKSDITPANAVLATAMTDGSTITVTIGVEGGNEKYTPATIRVNDIGLDEIIESSTKRWFIGTVTIPLEPGDNTVTLTSSEGGTDSVIITRLGAGPNIISVTFGSYPGSQTELKADDNITVTINAVPEAVSARIIQYGANVQEQSVLLTNGVGTATITISDLTEQQPIQVIARNAFGTDGTVFTSQPLTLNQTYPVIGDMTVSYPSGKLAFDINDTGTVTATVTGYDTILYSSNNDFTITSPSIYSNIKNIESISVVGYSYNVNNYAITATRTANNAISIRSIPIAIASEPATAFISIVGSPTRLTSSAAGIDYEIRITPYQKIQSIQNLTTSTGTFQGSWVDHGVYFSRTLRITDNDVKGLGQFANLSLLGLSNIEGTVLTSGSTFTVGGFSSRTITFPAFSRIAPIGTSVSDQTKTAVTIVGGNVLTRYTDNNIHQNGYYIANSSGVYNPNGSYIGLSDSSFAGSNTSGTLQATIQETA